MWPSYDHHFRVDSLPTIARPKMFHCAFNVVKCLKQASSFFFISLCSKPRRSLTKIDRTRMLMLARKSGRLAFAPTLKIASMNIPEMSPYQKLDLESIITHINHPLMQHVMTNQNREFTSAACGTRKLNGGYIDLHLLSAETSGLRLTIGTNYSRLLYH